LFPETYHIFNQGNLTGGEEKIMKSIKNNQFNFVLVKMVKVSLPPYFLWTNKKTPRGSGVKEE
jgi:hypothetical protein